MSGWANKGSRHERGYGAAWVKTRALVLSRDMHLCQPCLVKGRPTPADQVDHITSKAKGGSDDLENLQAICHDCHKAKTADEAAEAQGRRVKQRIGIDGWPSG